MAGEVEVIIDGHTVPAHHVLETDVCVIGAGPAGISVARELAASDLRVMILESGGVEPDPEAQMLSDGENIGRPYYPLDASMFRGLGGSTLGWELGFAGSLTWARFAPLEEIDFEKRDWVPYSGWPFSRDHLVPYYIRAQDVLGLGPFTYSIDDWVDPDATPILPIRDEFLATVVFQFGSGETFTRNYRDELIASDNVTVVQHATAITIDLDELGQKVKAVSAASFRGNRFRVSARTFVLAGGGIENPRLLLASNHAQEEGIGNQHDLVGRFFMEHPHLVTGVLVPSDPNMLGQLVHSDIHLVNGTPVQRRFRLASSLVRSAQILGYAFRLTPAPWTDATRYLSRQRSHTDGTRSLKHVISSLRSEHRVPAGAVGDLRKVTADLGNVGMAALIRTQWELEKRWKRRFGRTVGPETKPSVYHLNVMCEQAPNPSSRVTLSDRVNALGMRLLDPACRQAKLDWRLSNLDTRTMLKGQDVIRAEFERAQVGRVHLRLDDENPPRPIWGGHHQMGTTRMHSDPRHGVVNADCRVHGVPNLFVAGSSVFPTVGYANPTLTIVALALRLADRLKKEMMAPAPLGTEAVPSPPE